MLEILMLAPMKILHKYKPSSLSKYMVLLEIQLQRISCYLNLLGP